MAAEALIFDLDGTVWDSAGWFAAALSRGDAAATEALRDKLETTGNIVREAERAGMTRKRLLTEAERLGGPPPLFDGVRDVLAELAGRDTPLAVATSLPGSIALPMIDAAGLQSIFDTVVHAGLCRTPKPNPAVINMALRFLSVRPSTRSFYVGDRAVDAEAAQRAGISMAWVAHGYEVPAPDSGVETVHVAELLDL